LGFFFYLPSGDESGVISRLLMFAPLVVFPLALPQIEPSSENRSNLFKTAVFLQPMAATIVGVSFLVQPGVLSATFAVVWLPYSLFLAWHGLQRLRSRGPAGWISAVEETCMDVGMIYLPVGAIWLIGGRLGLEVLGFTEPIVTLTAIHFHFAGFAAPLITGLAGRRLRQKTQGGKRVRGRWLYFPVACLVMLGPALVAAGIGLSPFIETTGAALLALGYVGLGSITIFMITPSLASNAARVALALSSLAVILAMVAAVVFAFGQYSATYILSIPQMLNLHGWINAVGFVFLGVLGWGLAD
jgi:hypothetical protein